MLNIKDVIGTIVRGAVQGAAGWLVLKGVIPTYAAASLVDSVTGVVVGALVILATYVWSLISKEKALEKMPVVEIK